MTRGRAIADSLRRKTLPDTSAGLTDTGLFDLPSPALPGIGRVAGLTDTAPRPQRAAAATRGE